MYAFNEGVKDAIADKFESFKTGLNKQEREKYVKNKNMYDDLSKEEKIIEAKPYFIGFSTNEDKYKKEHEENEKNSKRLKEIRKKKFDLDTEQIKFMHIMAKRKKNINKGIKIGAGTTAVVGGIGIYKSVKDAKLYKIYKEYLKNHPDEKLSFRDWKRLMKIKKKINK